ncbi:MAG: anaerobic ribonucleoside-triphosphate reductase activating protein [Actinomycetota bacterium]
MPTKAVEIKGFIPVTMLDWDGKLASTLFVGGCNLRCPFCQNAPLITRPDSIPNVEWKEVEKHLKAKKSWLDGCVVTGGEPTIHSGLKNLLSEIKKLEYPVKLDTNGTLPRVLRQLIQDKLVDFMAMDIKTALPKYPLATRTKIKTEIIKESIHLILRLGIDHEFRTTVVPRFVEREDILEVAKYLGHLGAKRYVLQQFNPRTVLDPEVGKIKPYSREYLLKLVEECNKFVPTKLRGAG